MGERERWGRLGTRGYMPRFSYQRITLPLLESLVLFVVVALAGDAREVRGVPALHRRPRPRSGSSLRAPFP